MAEKLNAENVLITGVAGFIGRAVAAELLRRGVPVTGLDNLNDYYDVALKQARLATLSDYPGFKFAKIDLGDYEALNDLMKSAQISLVIHLAAQAGVRYSMDNPAAYVQSNLEGFFNVLEVCRQNRPAHLVFASTSSVYGLNQSFPYVETACTDHPLSFYAATKKANESMAHAYANLYGIPTTGLRFFTVYGPWMRPDMALYKFALKMINGEPIDLYNQGEMVRDFTYIDDIVEGVLGACSAVPESTGIETTGPSGPVAGDSTAPWQIMNIGNGRSVPLIDYVDLLEKHLGIQANRNYLSMQPGEVLRTWSNIEKIHRATGYTPKVTVEIGVARFVSWFKSYHLD